MALRFIATSVFLIAFQCGAAEYRILVDNPESFAVETTLEEVVVGAAEQLTGMPAADLTANTTDLFSLPEALVNSYGFDGGFFLVDVDIDGLKSRLETAGIDIWSGKRPQFLVWATEERGLDRVMVGNELNSLIDALFSGAARYALPLNRPLMDLDDTLALSPAEIWGEFSGAVLQASARYKVDHVLVLGDRPDQQSLRFWIYGVGQNFTSGEVSGADAKTRAEGLMSILLQYAKSLSLESVPESVPESELLVESFLEQTAKVTLPETKLLSIDYDEVLVLMAFLDYLEIDPAQVKISEISMYPELANIVLETELSMKELDGLVSGFGAVQFVSPLVYALR